MAKTVALETSVLSAEKATLNGYVSYSGNYSWYVGTEMVYGSYSSYVVGEYVPTRVINNISKTAVIKEIVISVSVSASGGSHSICGGALSADLDYVTNPNVTEATTYEAINAVPATWILETGKDHTIRVTDASLIDQIMQYGVGFRKYTSGTWKAQTFVNLLYSYSDPYETPEVSGVSAPSYAFLCDDIPLAWNYSQSADVAQSYVDVQLCRGGAEWKTVADKQSVSGHQITVNLKNTDLYFTDADELEAWTFRVRAYAGSNATPSEWSETYAVKLQILRPKLISPAAGENRLATEAVRLTWTLQEMPTGTPAGFSVLYSTDAGETWESHEGQYADVIRDGDTWYRDISANTLPHGIVQWKVYVWTTDNAVSFSVPVETFRAVIQASTSSVSCDGKPIPTLSWTSTSQAAYQVRFGDYDSGAVYGAAKQHTVPYVYADGLYAAQVRTQAITGEWSDWTEETFVQIRNVKPSFGVTLSAQSTRHTVILTWTAAASAEGYILYREGVPVYVGKDASFTDRTANGKKTYFVRAVTSAKYYAQSAEIIADATPKNDCICDNSTGEWIALRYSSSPRRRSISEGEKVTYKWYAGRKYPVAFTEGYSERTGNFSYCFRRREDAVRLAALSGKTVIYKGTDGTVMYGIMGAVQIVGEILYDVSFSVTEIDHTEEVAYEIA